MSMLIKLCSIMFAFMLLVSFHELGHYLAAKWARVKVLKFALGFPPWIFSIKLGETVYSVGMTLMGGFVRMLGEEMVVGENEVLDERDYRGKPIWKRAIIILAGPVFSLFLALPLTIYCLSMGVLQPPPVLGPQPENSPFKQANLQAGDRIIEMDGTPIYHRPALLMHTLLNCDHPMTVRALRMDAEGNYKELPPTTIQPFHMSLDLQDATKLYMAGMEQAKWNMRVKFKEPGFQYRHAFVVTMIGDPFKKDGPPTPAAAAHLKVGDEILAINGQPVDDFDQLVFYVREHGDKPMTMTIIPVDKPATRTELKLQAVNLSEETGAAKSAPDYKLGMSATTVNVVTEVSPGSAAAKAGVVPGMIMQPEYEANLANIVWATSTNPFNPQEVAYYNIPDRAFQADSVKSLLLEFAAVPAGKNRSEVFFDLIKATADTPAPEPVVKLTVDCEAAALTDEFYMPTAISPEAAKLPDLYLPGAVDRMELQGDHQEYQQIRGAGNLLQASWNYYLSQIYMMLQSLKKIFGDIFSAGRGVAGPLGIGKMLWSQGDFHGDQANLQFNKYLLFIAFISINLGIMNLLPIPILDGGHLLMLTIEAIRRKPLTRVFAERFQIVGMVILLGLFLFATTMDLMHLFG